MGTIFPNDGAMMIKGRRNLNAVSYMFLRISSNETILKCFNNILKALTLKTFIVTCLCLCKM